MEAVGLMFPVRSGLQSLKDPLSHNGYELPTAIGHINSDSFGWVFYFTVPNTPISYAGVLDQVFAKHLEKLFL